MNPALPLVSIDPNFSHVIARLKEEITNHEREMASDPERHEARIIELRWAIARLTPRHLTTYPDRTAGPWEANLHRAEKVNAYECIVPVYSGGAAVGYGRGPTMPIAIANAEFIAHAPNLERELELVNDALRAFVFDVLPAAMHAIPRVAVTRI